MVTASHNPASDSGVKLFDADGRKSLPALEARLATRAWDLAEYSDDSPPDPELCRPSSLMAATTGHRATLAKRLELFATRLGIDFTGRDWSDVIAPSGLLLDSSGGAASDWFAAGLAKRGIDAREVADRERDINDSCGAGDFSPTSVWTYDDLLRRVGNNDDSHALLDALAELVSAAEGAPDWQPGLLVGAALDGDGDRCLLIEARENGIGVVDGDRMGDDWLRALEVTRSKHSAESDKPESNGMAEVVLATTIETDLALPASLKRFSPVPQFIECAVGDRWVAEALAPTADTSSRLLVSPTMPEIIGCEDSGHLILPAPHPRLDNHWSLVGDGAATLLAMLCARAVLAKTEAGEHQQAPKPFVAGWKRRESVRGVDRNLWTGSNAVADEAEEIVRHRLNETGNISDWQRGSLNGEKNLMLIRCRVDGIQFSAGIRNSGTEAKTTISLRAAPNFPDLSALITLLEELIDSLSRRLIA
jgi:phosphomannomutase